MADIFWQLSLLWLLRALQSSPECNLMLWGLQWTTRFCWWRAQWSLINNGISLVYSCSFMSVYVICIIATFQWFLYKAYHVSPRLNSRTALKEGRDNIIISTFHASELHSNDNDRSAIQSTAQSTSTGPKEGILVIKTNEVFDLEQARTHELFRVT